LVNLKTETTTLIISFITSVILGIIIIPILKKLKIGQSERLDGPRAHLKKQGTPTMGGIIMIITMLLIVTGTYIFLSANGQSEIANKLLPILLLTIGFGLIGFIDDFKKLVLKNTEGLNPKLKMLGLLIIATIYTIFLVIISWVIFAFDDMANVFLYLKAMFGMNGANCKRIYYNANIYLYTICNSSNTCSNKCNKLNRRNWRISIKC